MVNARLKWVLVGITLEVVGMLAAFIIFGEVTRIIETYFVAAYGTQEWVGLVYLELGEFAGMGANCLVGVVIARSNIRKRAALAAGIAIPVNWLMWVGIAYGVVVAYNANNILSVRVDDFWLVQAHAAVYLFPGGVPYFWTAVDATYAVWFTFLLQMLYRNPPVRYQLQEVKVPKRPKQKRRQRYKLNRRHN